MTQRITLHDIDCLIEVFQGLREETYQTELLAGRRYTPGREEELEKHLANLPSSQAIYAAERMDIAIMSLWESVHRQNRDHRRDWISGSDA